MKMGAITKLLEHGLVIMGGKIVEQPAHIARWASRAALELEERIVAIFHSLQKVGINGQRSLIAFRGILETLQGGKCVSAVVPADRVTQIDRESGMETPARGFQPLHC